MPAQLDGARAVEGSSFDGTDNAVVIDAVVAPAAGALVDPPDEPSGS